MPFGSQLNAHFGSTGALAILGELSSAVAGAGTTQGTATLLTSANNLVTSGAAGSGVRLPATPTVSANDRLHVANQTSVNIWVYPPSGGKIGNSTANVGAQIAPNKAADFFCIDGTNFTAVLSA